MNRGKRLVEILKQPQYKPLPVEKQVAIIFAGTNGLLDDLEVEDCRAFETELYKFLDNSKPAILAAIRDKKTIDDALKTDLTAAINEVKEPDAETQAGCGRSARLGALYNPCRV